MSLLEIERINTFYGDSHILFDVSLGVGRNEVVALLGRNGAGKTTTLRTIMGVLAPRRGRITLDGRPLPEPSQPAYLGYSVGRWEGDTLVVETNGLNDRGWLDKNGHPQTETTRYTERFHRRTFGHMDLELTVEDPKAYAKPWTVALAGWDLLPDEELIEAICDNERDSQRLIGK